ncbi:hypothetical protein Cgig2_014335 [Carnegiea gigantea]|uniref:Aminotransferase-like plant mobile domain-containing protein n=1 Tax=Carnegiea gigantea TaxID=171969 RepID=A0A9Q1GTR7_9CARY|nr:hypothetical protein Cgig2_014335 [Carnegiea gigantea]
MAEPPEGIMEEREGKMVSPKGGNAVQKLAHFIQPTLGLADPTPEKPLIYQPSKPTISKVNFNGWRNPTQQWISWVDRLHSSYQFIWKNAGIYDAVLSSRYKIVKNQDLFFGLAERWCSETNTFVFSWGEATISLEDVMVLGGYSVLGDSVSGSGGEREFAQTEKKLMNAHDEIKRGKSQRACQSQWMKHFRGVGSEIEHEAFLSLWLSSATQVKKTDNADDSDDLFVLTLWAPLHLVQVWAWERFPEFRPNPNAIEYGEPRLARWHAVNESENGNVRPMLQSAGDSFKWRPYCKRVDNLPLPAFYRENAERVLVGSDFSEDVLALVRILRVCELVGMDSIEKYKPHRVAMQFGFDQDVPSHVKQCSMTFDVPKRDLLQLAWLSYTSPIRDQTLYVPSKFYRPMVTVRYLAWHRQGVLTKPATFPGVTRKRRNPKRLRGLQEIKVVEYVADNEADLPPGFSPKRTVDHHHDMLFSFFTKNVGNESDFPPGFAPKSGQAFGLDVFKREGPTVSNCMPNSMVMLREECSEFESKENSKLCLTSTSQNLCSSFAEIDSDVEKRAMIPAIEAPLKIELVMSGCERISNDHRNGVTQMTSAHDREEKLSRNDLRKEYRPLKLV